MSDLSPSIVSQVEALQLSSCPVSSNPRSSIVSQIEALEKKVAKLESMLDKVFEWTRADVPCVDMDTRLVKAIHKGLCSPAMTIERQWAKALLTAGFDVLDGNKQKREIVESIIGQEPLLFLDSCAEFHLKLVAAELSPFVHNIPFPPPEQKLHEELSKESTLWILLLAKQVKTTDLVKLVKLVKMRGF